MDVDFEVQEVFKNDPEAGGSVVPKYEPVASHGDPFMPNIAMCTWYQVLSTQFIQYSTVWHSTVQCSIV